MLFFLNQLKIKFDLKFIKIRLKEEKLYQSGFLTFLSVKIDSNL